MAPGVSCVAVAAGLAFLATACGDPLASASSRGDPLLELYGSVTAGAAGGEPVLQAMEVGVMWLGVDDQNQNLELDVTVADAIGTHLPAAFQVAVQQPPREALLGNGSIYGYYSAHVPASRVALGVLVVADHGTLALLPETASKDLLMGQSSSEPLEESLFDGMRYVTPYAVVYVRDAEQDGLVDEYGDPVRNFSLHDLSGFAAFERYRMCADEVTLDVWDSEEVTSCIAARANELADADRELDDCLDGCEDFLEQGVSEVEATENWADYEDCRSDCSLTHTGRMEIENWCYATYADPIAEQTCGREPEDAGIRKVDPNEALTLPLGEDDIRDALTHWGVTWAG